MPEPARASNPYGPETARAYPSKQDSSLPDPPAGEAGTARDGRRPVYYNFITSKLHDWIRTDELNREFQ